MRSMLTLLFLLFAAPAFATQEGAWWRRSSARSPIAGSKDESGS